MTKNGLGVAVAVAVLGAIFYFGQPTKQTVPAPETPTPAVVRPPVTRPVPPRPGHPNPNPVYHRVEQNGGRGPQVACTSVRPFAEGKTPAELTALATQYGVTVAVVRTWFVCVN